MARLTHRRSRLWALVAAAAAVALGGMAVSAWPERTAGLLRERAVDAALARLERPPPGEVMVIDVDQASLAALGAWPWPRERIAALIEGVTAAGPRAIAIDILLEGSSRGSRNGPSGLDADARLARAIADRPIVLAALLDPVRRAEDAAPPRAPVAFAGAAPRLRPWSAAGVALPHPPLAEEAAEVAITSLAADADGRIRRVPLFATAGGDLYAGIGAATLRRAASAGAYIVTGRTGEIGVGGHVLPLAEAADLRFSASGPARWRARTVSAAALLAPGPPQARLKGKIVVLGGSAPALGALRQTAESPVAPSVQIQADAIEAMLSGRIPVRPDGAWRWEVAGALALAALGAALGALMGPGLAALGAALAAAVWASGAVAALVVQNLVVDPATPALAGVLATAAAGLVTAAETRRTAAAMRRRFERHLAPAVVARIAQNPGLVKLDGERREVTALFTDIEGFAATADALEPEELIALLDAYFTGVTALVIAHGGMVDKIVGDAVHALFNAPLDLDDHPAKAVRCALAIAAFAEDFRDRPDAADAEFGRTRIGIETGPAVVGDVGSGVKLDYTAHGAAVNAASRLEALNKGLGTSICVGPTCRARTTGVAFRPLGAWELRGVGRMEVFEPQADGGGA